MTTGEGNGENGNGMLFFDACAMAKRSIHETILSGEQSFALRGQSHRFETLPEEMVDVMALGQAHLIVDTIQGNEPRTIKEYIASSIAVMSDESIAELFLEGEEDPEEDIEPDHLREFFADLMENTMEFQGQTHVDAEGIQKFYEVATQMAEENGQTVEDIFSSDELYAEVVRRTYSAEEFCQKRVEEAHKISPKSIADLMYKNSLATLRLEASSEYSEIAPEDIEQLDVQAQKYIFKATAVEEFYTARRVLAIQSITRLKRFWGEDVLDKMPINLREDIEELAKPPVEPDMPQRVGRSLTSKFLSGAFPTNYKPTRSDFVRNYCQSEGINPDDLSFEQIIMIHGLIPQPLAP